MGRDGRRATRCSRSRGWRPRPRPRAPRLRRGPRGRPARAHPPGGPGKDDGDRAGAREGRDLLGLDEEQVVGGSRRELGGEQGPARARELVGVDAEAQPGAARGLENGPRLLDGEDALLAEDVAEEGELLPGGPRHDHFGDDPDPLGAVSGELRRDLVGREKRRDEAGQVRVARELPQERERPDLVGLGQPVSRLGLGRRRAVVAHRHEALAHGGGQLVVGARAGRPHGGVDPAAFRRDRGVAFAGEAPRDLGAAVAEPDRVGVGVDEAGHDRAAARIEGDIRGTARELPRRSPPPFPRRRAGRPRRARRRRGRAGSRPEPSRGAPRVRAASPDSRCCGPRERKAERLLRAPGAASACGSLRRARCARPPAEASFRAGRSRGAARRRTSSSESAGPAGASSCRSRGPS